VLDIAIIPGAIHECALYIIQFLCLIVIFLFMRLAALRNEWDLLSVYFFSFSEK